MVTVSYVVFLVLLGRPVWTGDAAQLALGCPGMCDCSQTGVVDCSSRDLVAIPEAFPNDTVVVNLSHNNIVSVGARAFMSSPWLQIINLDNCAIESLAPFAFTGMTNVTSIFLRSNKIHTISENTFNGVRGRCENGSLRGECTLDMTGNPLQAVDGHAFNNSKHIDILLGKYDGNLSLKSFAFSGYEGPLLSVSNITNIIFTTPLPFNGMRNVSLVFFGYSTIQKLRSRLFYGSQGLGKIVFHKCSILEIQSNTFTGTHFNLEKNYNESEIKQADTVVSGRIEIRDSVFETLPYNMFKGCNVGGITLYGNAFKHVKKGAFRGIDELCHLKLSRNKFPKITHEFLIGLRNVALIEILNNEFTAIENGAFTGLSNIGRVVIEMKDVPKTITIESNAFRSMSNVGTLQMRYVNADFEAYAFSGVSKLGLLSIEHINEKTNVTSLPKNVFNGLDVNRLYIESAGKFKPEKGVFDSLAVVDVNIHFAQTDCECQAKQLVRVLKNVAKEYYVQCRTRASFGKMLTKNTEIQDVDFTDCEGDGSESSGVSITSLSLFIPVIALASLLHFVYT